MWSLESIIAQQFPFHEGRSLHHGELWETTPHDAVKHELDCVGELKGQEAIADRQYVYNIQLLWVTMPLGARR